MEPSITRRDAMAALASVALSGVAGPARAAASSMPDAPSLLVASPPGGTLDRWANSIADPLGSRLFGGAALARENVGGPDGVTGANHYQARTTPDGATALLAPGAAMLAWLAGDTRVRFDAGNWAPLWGGDATAMVASRVKLVPRQQVRIVVQDLVGPELAALLALTLMGVDAVPVAPNDFDPLLRSDVDVVFLRGRVLRQRAAQLALHGWSPAFSLGATAADGRLERSPAYPGLPVAQELFVASPRTAGPELAQAMRPVAAAATLDVALVLPIVAPAAVVAWWRRGCESLADAPAVREEAATALVRPMGAGPMAASLASITVEAPVLLGLRRWLAERYQWHPV